MRSVDSLKTVDTNCAYCGVGCGIKMKKTGRDEWVATGDESHPANLGRLCRKGSTLGETLRSKGRLSQPTIDNNLVSVDEASHYIAEKFQKILDQHGPSSIGFYVSGQLLTEDYYVANKFVKGYIGTANIDTNSRLCMASTVVGHKRAFGGDLVPANYEDLELCDMAVIVGSNMAQCHPVLFQRLIERPSKPFLVCIDPRESETAKQSDLHLPIAPGSDIALFNGLLKFVTDHGGVDLEFAEESLSGFSKAAKVASEYSIEMVADICRLSAAQILNFYNRFLKTEKTLTLFSQGINQSSVGVDKVNAILNTHLITGRVGKPGSSPFSLTGQFNAMGGREVGGLANQLAAHMNIDSPEDRQLLKEFWKSPRICDGQGLKAIDLFQATADGEIKALWIMATNPMVSMPNKNLVRRALENCPLVIVSESFIDAETLHYADVVLPAASWGEKDGTTTNSDRTIARQKGFKAAPGASLQDWQWIAKVAKAMGFEKDFNYKNSAAIFREHARLSNIESSQPRAFRLGFLESIDDKAYEKLKPIHWPVAKDSLQGSARLFGDGKFFTANRRAQLIPTEHRSPRNLENHDATHFILNTGRSVNQWHTMTRTRRAQSLNLNEEAPFVHVNPRDLSRLSEQAGIDHEPFLIKLENSFGSCLLRTQSDPGQKEGEIFAPFHWGNEFAKDASVNALVPPTVDLLSGQPEFKASSVKAEAVDLKTFGIFIAREAFRFPETTWWQKIPLKRFNLILFADVAPFEEQKDLKDFIHNLLPEDPHPAWSIFRDTETEEYSAIQTVDEFVQRYLFIAPDHSCLPKIDIVLEYMLQDESLDRSQRYYLHSGS